MTEVLTAAPTSCEVLAARWLEAEERAGIEPTNATLAQEAVRLAQAYEDAIRAATQEELRLAWEAARQRQGRELIGTREWGDARRVSELLRTEYAAARPSPADARPD
jgi:hypothetical protein